MVFEVVLFKLRESVNEADFLKFNDTLNDWLATTPGYISRDLTRDDNGQWVDIVRWESMEQAISAAETMPMMDEMGGYLDSESINMMHLRHAA